MSGERHWWWQRPFLYIGRMAEDKGVVTIIHAWETVKYRSPDLCPPLWLAGGAPDEIDHIRTIAGFTGSLATYEREGAIQWWGYLDPSGLSALLTRACALVMHSRYEPGGRVVLEAMAQGVPVIATPYGFAKDLIEDWYNGFLVAFEDNEALVQRMMHFVQQPLLRNTLGAAAKETAHSALNAWDFLDRHCKVYDQAVGKAPESEVGDTALFNASAGTHKASRYVRQTYPYTHSEPDKETVVSFVERNVDSTVTAIERVVNGPGSSIRWRIRCDAGDFMVKWPYSRLRMQVLWDTLCVDTLMTPATVRFARDCFSGGLPRFCPLTASDPDLLLMLRPAYPIFPKTVAPDVLREVAAGFRELAQFPLPTFQWETLLERDWDTTNLDDISTILNTIRGELATTPWAFDRHVSVRLSWRKTELAVRQCNAPIMAKTLARQQDSIAIFRNLAKEEAGRGLGVSHGSGDLTHCLRTPDGRMLFIDGEHVHPSQPGEDVAATLFYAIEDVGVTENEELLWPKLLESVAADSAEQRLVLAWAGLIAFEDVQKNIAMLHKNVSRCLARWEALTRVAAEHFSQ